ncbi:hypothetical protein MSIBF_A2240005 [groundwater metagenome]|uniref:Uncharacterized protein n=1 Tax=groundwater metagenome TaxID=717931 RepID=A0A098EBI7_9ZZZZ
MKYTYIDNSSNIYTGNINNNKQEISAICFSSLPLVNFGDERAAFFGVSLKTTAKATISESNIKIYGCDELKNELETLINKIFKKFEFPYGINIQIFPENKNDKFSIFSAVGIAAYGIVAIKYGIIYDEIMEKKLRSDKTTKRKLIKIRKKIYTYNEIFDDVVSLINSDTNFDINYIQAYSSYFGGIAVGKMNETNNNSKHNSECEILRYGENENSDVVLIPKGKENRYENGKENDEKNKDTNINGAEDILWDEILKGNFYTAANLGCIVKLFKDDCKFYEMSRYLMKDALYCGMTDNYILGVFRKGTNKNLGGISEELKNLRKFNENLIMTTANNSPAGIY